MLWAVWNEWPSGAWFSFNFYRHWSTLVIRAGNRTGHFLYSMEGVTQGDPLAIGVYGVVILPLIQLLRKAYPGVTKPLYVDNAGAGMTFEGVFHYLDKLMVQGTLLSYFPEPTKSIMFLPPQNVPQAEAFFEGFHHRYFQLLLPK